VATGARVATGSDDQTTRVPPGPRRLLYLWVPLILTVTAGALVASRQEPRFSTTSDLVVLHVNVRDRDGGFISDLPQQAFAVFEDLRPQPLSLFVNDDAPVTVGLVIDNSISMRENRLLVIAAAEEFARSGHARDEVFALAFNEHVSPVLPPGTPFTGDSSTLGAALTGAITAQGKTALFDAVLAGIAYADRGTHPRKVLVVIGDGGDNASTATFDATVKAVQTSNATIYTVVLADPLDPEANPGRMARLARVSGGETFRPRSAEEISRVLQSVARDIRHTYTIGYTPDRAADGTYRRVRVIVTPPDSRRVVVRTREGYVADEPMGEKGDRIDAAH
jgi:Ca-activated chloride channel family protein